MSCARLAMAQEDSILRSLPKFLNHFDNVILTYQLNVGDWQVMYDMMGYGIKGNRAFKIKMTVLSYSGGCVDGVIKKIELMRELNKSLIDSVKKINFSAIQELRTNIINCPGESEGIRDGDYYFIIVKHKKGYSLLKSYEPDFPQKYEQSRECAIFIKARNELVRILGNSK